MSRREEYSSIRLDEEKNKIPEEDGTGVTGGIGTLSSRRNHPILLFVQSIIMKYGSFNMMEAFDAH